MPKLPAPPESFLTNLLAGVKSLTGLDDPIANARITHTPIHTAGPLYPAAAGAQYYRLGNRIEIPPERLQENANYFIPHESSHALYSAAKLSPEAIQGVPLPEDARWTITSNPNLYPNPSPDTMANEGLAYSIGYEDATPFIEHVASRIKDPALAQQLLRLHRTAILARSQKTQQPALVTK